MNRREFLLSSVALTATAGMARDREQQIVLNAAATNKQIVPVQHVGPTRVLGFNESLPGPEIRSLQGQPIDVLLQNNLGQGTALHWHGIRLNNAMDGVPDLTQKLVKPGETFNYKFTAKDAGTFWYHSHHVSNEQVARGLMGPLIVEEAVPPDVDHDICAILMDWLLDEEGQLAGDFSNMHDIAHAGRLGNFAKAFLPDVNLKRGERIRLRLINAAVDRIFPLKLTGFAGKIVALDGMPLQSLQDIDQMVLAPAQRADIIADVTQTVRLELDQADGAYLLGTLEVAGEKPARKTPVPSLPANERPEPGDVSQKLSLHMTGGAMGGHHGGGGIWAFNDVSGMQPEPFGRFERGQTATISLINDTAFPHGIHLHGHHFFEVKDDGSLGELRDTSLVDAGQTRDILCVFDNPGRWLLHCHMLSHQAGGMKTWVEVM